MLNLTRTRCYGPTIGRFFHRDPAEPVPVAWTGSISPYAYCGNDPVNFADKNGRDRVRCAADIADRIEGGIEYSRNFYLGHVDEQHWVVRGLSETAHDVAEIIIPTNMLRLGQGISNGDSMQTRGRDDATSGSALTASAVAVPCVARVRGHAGRPGLR